MKVMLEFAEIGWTRPCTGLSHKFTGKQSINIGLIGLTYGIYHTQHPTIQKAKPFTKSIAYLKALADSMALTWGDYPKHLADHEKTAFWGRIGAALGYIALARGGYTFIFSIEKANPFVDLKPNPSLGCPTSRTPDFLLDSGGNFAILETKGNSLFGHPPRPLSSTDKKNLIGQVLPYHGGIVSFSGFGGAHTISHAWYSRLYPTNRGHREPNLFLSHTPNSPWSARARPKLLSFVGRVHYQKVFSIIGLPLLERILTIRRSNRGYFRRLGLFLEEGIISRVIFKGRRFLFMPIIPFFMLIIPFSLFWDWDYLMRHWWYYRDYIWLEWYRRPYPIPEEVPLYALEEGYFRIFLNRIARIIIGGEEPEGVWDGLELPPIESFDLGEDSEREGDRGTEQLLTRESRPVLFPDGVLGFTLSQLQSDSQLEIDVQSVRVRHLLS